MARLDGLLELAHFPLEIGKGKLGKPHADEELPLRFGQGQHRLDRREEGLQSGAERRELEPHRELGLHLGRRLTHPDEVAEELELQPPPELLPAQRSSNFASTLP